jgi:2-C-methyl-D-erythritol 2,4-cyclodiphosphate synthase
MMEIHSHQIGNVDLTIICEQPKLSKYILVMQQKLSYLLNANTNQVNIKATTTEKMGYTGRMEGIACHCVVLLEDKMASLNL